MAITSALRGTDWFGTDYDLSKRSHLMTDEAVPVYDDEPATPILDVLATMTEAAVEASDLDPAAQILLRFAALVALDAAPASYLFHFGAGAEQGLTLEDARQVLVTLAPVVGTARIVSASSKISRALGFALAVSELADEEDADQM
jgi:alkylhydroperoxidase/carboxymuconolactone decarboxylase family protein YurZ